MSRGEGKDPGAEGRPRPRRFGPARQTASAIVLAAAALLAAEAAARVPAVSSRLPLPSRGIAHPSLDLRVELADRWARSGPAECVILGPSSTGAAVRPAVISAAFRESAGRGLRAFDFGVAGMALPGASALGRVIVERYRPGLLVVGVFPYHVMRNAALDADDLILSDPWVRQRLGHSSLRGWMADRLVSFRAFLGARQWLEKPTEYAARARAAANLEPTGDRVSDAPVAEENGAGPGTPGPAREPLVAAPDMFRDFERLLDLGSGTTLVLVEALVRPGSHGRFARGGPEYRRILDDLAAAARRRGVPFLRPGPRRFGEPALWRDRNHMNRRGAELYSRWLGGRLASLVRDGRIPDPAQASK